MEDEDGNLVCARRQLKVFLSKTATGPFDLQLNSQPRRTVWSKEKESIVIVPHNLSPVEGNGWSSRFPETFGSWTFMESDSAIVVKNSESDRELRLGIVDFKATAKRDGDEDDDDDSDDDDQCKWRVKLGTKPDELHLCRRNLEIILTDASNGWFQMALNGDDKETIFSTREDRTIGIAPGNIKPFKGPNFSSAIPSRFTNWRLERQGETIRITNSEDNDIVLILADTSFRYGPRASIEGDTASKWRIQFGNDVLRCRRKGLLVELPGDSNGFFRLQINNEPFRTVFSREEGQVEIAGGNMAPDDGPGWLQPIAARVGTWQLLIHEEHNNTISIHNQEDGRVLLLSEKEFVFTKSGVVLTRQQVQNRGDIQCPQQ